ncbi:DUF6092 family protein [Streptomyces sp. NPDC057116]|uniref:DUF6092 family protein n=1 Tax=Streptomyces sp. NPDC057116 TaxID=3346023 RepID=UPI003640CFB4
METSVEADRMSLHADLASLAAYLLSAGRGLLQEPAAYSTVRCMDAARRTLGILETHTAADPRLVALRSRLDELVTGPQDIKAPSVAGLLDDLCLTMAPIIKESA